jgi:Fur family zinc uptake transcriptional regulator
MNSGNNHNNCEYDAFNVATQICQEKNIRFTNLRKKVFSIIAKDHKPAKAYDILSLLQKEDNSAKPSTVYRTLDFLLEHNLIHKLHISNSYVSCTHPLKHQKCYFLICNKCNQVSECCNDQISKEIDQIALNYDFKISESIVEIKGTCKACN